jgi:hypothetical protein
LRCEAITYYSINPAIKHLNFAIPACPESFFAFDVLHRLIPTSEDDGLQYFVAGLTIEAPHTHRLTHSFVSYFL